MNKLVLTDNKEFYNITIKNPNNTKIIDEFKRYYHYIYNNINILNKEKPTKELFYKLAAIKKVIKTLAIFKDEIKNGEQVRHLKGIGKKTVDRIDEIIKFGYLNEIKEERDKETAINKLSKIYGIGPIKAGYLFEKYNINNVEELINAENDKKIKLTDQMKLGIKYYDKILEDIPRSFIAYLDLYITKQLKKIDNNFINVICGSYRRNKATSKDIDLLITHKNIKNKNETQKYLKIIVEILKKDFIVDSLTDINTSKSHYQGFITFYNIKGKFTEIINKYISRLDIIVVPHESFFPALLHFTGSFEFNQKMRLIAKELNMKLNEYGLYLNVNNELQAIKINSEEEIFKLLNMKYIKPELR